MGKLVEGHTQPGQRVSRISNVRALKGGLVVATVGLWSWLHWIPTSSTFTTTTTTTPADEWKDDIWPIREGTPWDIATDFPRPRTLEYDVQEGTWLLLDVHPNTGDIIFDMVGDIYCISAADASSKSGAIAHPVLNGAPYDADPHFSPEGDRIVYRSDAGLGLENIWVVDWNGCGESDVESTRNSGEYVVSGRLSHFLTQSHQPSVLRTRRIVG